MSQMNDKTLKDYILGRCTKEQLKAIDNWIDENADNARRLFAMEEAYHAGRASSFGDAQRINNAEERLMKAIRNEEQIHSIPIWSKVMRYAAAIIAIVVLGAISYFTYKSYTQAQLIAIRAIGEVKEIVLPDSTHVWLNQGAMIRYPRKFESHRRNVEIQGEALFRVTKNPEAPFSVKGEAVTTRVLGTTFNFNTRSQNNTEEVSLIEGRVEVIGNHNEGRIVMKPNQKVVFNKNTNEMEIERVNAQLDAVWHDNMIPFDNMRITEIARILERFYHVSIHIMPGVDLHSTYTGVIRRRETLDSVFADLTYSVPVSYHIKGNRVTLRAK